MEVVYLQGIANFVKKKIKKRRKKSGKKAEKKRKKSGKKAEKNLEVKKKGVPLQSRSGNERKRE